MLTSWIGSDFAQVVANMKAASSDSDHTLASLNLKSTEPGYVAFRPTSEVDDQMLWLFFNPHDTLFIKVGG